MLMLRKGMWVMCDGKLGIAVMDKHAWMFHAVDEDGATILVYPLPPSWRQASWNEIPESRRPSEARAARLGYL